MNHLLRAMMLLALAAQIGCSDDTSFGSGGGIKAPHSTNAHGQEPDDPDKSTISDKETEPVEVDVAGELDRDSDQEERLFVVEDASIQASGGVDIIFAFDTSGSMSGERRFLENNLAAFLSDLEKKSELDYQVFLLGGVFDLPGVSTERVFLESSTNISSRNSLDVLQDYFEKKRTNYYHRDKLRPSASNEIVIISDDNATMPASSFKKYLVSSKEAIGPSRVNGLVGLPDSKQNLNCRIANEGAVYTELGADSEVGGLIQDICETNWDLLLGKLADNIIEKNIRAVFDLDQTIDVSRPYDVTVNGKAIDVSMVSIEDGILSLSMDLQLQVGDEVRLTYYPAPNS